jgi:hypothetical protein
MLSRRIVRLALSLARQERIEIGFLHQRDPIFLGMRQPASESYSHRALFDLHQLGDLLDRQLFVLHSCCSSLSRCSSS